MVEWYRYVKCIGSAGEEDTHTFCFTRTTVKPLRECLQNLSMQNTYGRTITQRFVIWLWFQCWNLGQGLGIWTKEGLDSLEEGFSSNVLLYHVSCKLDHGIAAGCPYQEVLVQINIQADIFGKIIPPDSSELMFALNFVCAVLLVW